MKIVPVMVGLVMSLAYAPCLFAADTATTMQRLLDSRTDYEENWASLIRQIEHSPSEAGVYVKQPLWKNHIVVLVYDPSKKGKGFIDVVFHEGHLVDKWESLQANWGMPQNWKLTEAGTASGVFWGNVRVLGAHGTRVKVEYLAASPSGKGERTLVSQEIGMAFH